MKIKCTSCGRELENDFLICPFCGTKVKRTSAAPSAAPSASAKEAKENLDDLLVKLFGSSATSKSAPASAVSGPAPSDKTGAECNAIGMDYTRGRNGKRQDYKEATKWFKYGAEKGDKSAMYNLASNYSNARGIERDYAEARRWYEKACDLGSAGAANDLGHMYQHGLGVEVDGKRAYEYFQLAYERGSVAAICNLGYCLDHGIGVAADQKRATELFIQSAEKGSPAGANNLAFAYEHGRGIEKDPAKALEWYKTAYERGSNVAANNAGNMYKGGALGAPDYAAAKEWYEKAAAAGNVSASYSLGNLYFNGQGVTQSYEKAVEYYKKAAAAGNASAQNDLGHCYQHGKGIAKDEKAAFEWYGKAAKQGNTAGCNNVGFCYDHGIGVAVSYEKAVEFYKKAAANGSYSANNNLGYCYENGRGVPKDLAKAIYYYKESIRTGSTVAPDNLRALLSNASYHAELNRIFTDMAQNGEPDGYFGIAESFRYGRAAVRDPERAFANYLKAAEGGCEEAYGPLTACYCFGVGTERRADMAKHWGARALEYCNGKRDAESLLALGDIYYFGIGVDKSSLKAKRYYLDAAKQGSANAHNTVPMSISKHIDTIAKNTPSDDRFKFGSSDKDATLSSPDANGSYPLGITEKGFLAVDNTYIFTPSMINTLVVDSATKTITVLLNRPIVDADGKLNLVIDFARKTDADCDIGALAILIKNNQVNVKVL